MLRRLRQLISNLANGSTMQLTDTRFGDTHSLGNLAQILVRIVIQPEQGLLALGQGPGRSDNSPTQIVVLGCRLERTGVKSTDIE